MNFRTPEKPASIDIDLTPLINIVFLMLIFFMLAGTLKPSDVIQTAEMENAAKEVDQKLLVIVMTLEGDLLVDGQSVDQQALNVLLERTKSNLGKVAVKPDARLAAEQLLSLTEQLRDSGILEVTLIVEAP